MNPNATTMVNRRRAENVGDPLPSTSNKSLHRQQHQHQQHQHQKQTHQHNGSKKGKKKRFLLFEGCLLIITCAYLVTQSMFVSQHLEEERSKFSTHHDRHHLNTNSSDNLFHDNEKNKPSIMDDSTWSQTIIPTSPYAYTFLIGGIHETNIAYQGFLYNVLIATRLLRRLGSTADMICYLQLSSDSKLEQFPTTDLQALNQSNISILMLPTTTGSTTGTGSTSTTTSTTNTTTTTVSSFTNLMMDKFTALQLTQYRRVLYLDSDIMPLSNLDYLFRLSDSLDTTFPTVLQPNVIQASSGEPANGGMFLMEPKLGRYQQLLNVIDRQRKHQMDHDPKQRTFDNQWGWGHSFLQARDEWHAATKNGTLWFFHGGFADQGLLYYFFKYEIQQVSAIVGTYVEDWVPGSKDGPHLANRRDQLLLPYAPTPLIVHFQCQDFKEWHDYKCYPPYRDFYHFVGRSKPWQNPFLEKWFQRPKVKDLRGRSKLWFLELKALNQELHLGLDILNWNTKHLPFLKESPLGYIPRQPQGHNINDTQNQVGQSQDDANEKVASMDEMYRKNNMDDDSATSRGSQTISTDKLPSLQGYRYNATSLESIPARSPYAYAFIVGSVHENQTAYKGFLYNVMVSVQLLQRFGSKANYVIYLQLSPKSSLAQIPEEDIRLLQTMDIQIITLPKPKVESFSDLMFDKFRIFQLTQYKRVMYLDADIMPLTKLDYLFILSDPSDESIPTPLRPNIMQASSAEPANGGMFMVQPYQGAWQQVQAVINQQREDGKSLPYPNFHRGRGWGHKFRKKLKDNWHAAASNGTNWVFHGAHADQGLLYYFFRFVLQDTSHIVGRRVENWSANASDAETPFITMAYDNILMEYSNRHLPILTNPNCNLNSKQLSFNRAESELPYTCYPPYRDFVHFTGRSKPWQNELKTNWLESKAMLEQQSGQTTTHSTKFWFQQLEVLSLRLGLDLNLTEWNTRYLPTMKDSPLGYQPLYADNTNRIFQNHHATE